MSDMRKFQSVRDMLRVLDLTLAGANLSSANIKSSPSFTKVSDTETFKMLKELGDETVVNIDNLIGRLLEQCKSLRDITGANEELVKLFETAESHANSTNPNGSGGGGTSQHYSNGTQ